MKSIDPKLSSLLDEAAGKAATADAAAREIGAIITVQDLSPQAKALSPDDTARIVQRLVEKVERVTGIAPGELLVQRNLGTFLIHAKPDFLRALLAEDDVHHAASLESTAEPMLPPTRRRRLR